MKKFWNWLKDGIPFLWAVMWTIIITAVSVGGVIWSVSWCLEMMGVM